MRNDRSASVSLRMLGCLLALHACQANAESLEEQGRVTEVTLYRGQAMVTRTIPLPAGAGGHELVVGSLPETVLSESLFAEGGDGVEIRAVRYRSRAVGEAPREDVRALENELERIDQRIKANSKSQQVVAQRNEYLGQLEGFVAPTAKLELSKGVLDAAALEKMTQFLFKQREQVSADLLALEQEAADLAEQRKLVDRKIASITSGASRTVREAVLFLQKKGEDAVNVRLSYLVSGCGWSPSYTFRASEDRQSVELEYNGLIRQLTGEDWENVELTLSTASPALNAAVPGLAPFHVSLVPQSPQPPAAQQAQPNASASQQELFSRYKASLGKQQMAIAQNRATVKLSDNIRSAWQVNAAANEVQNLELLGGRELVRTSQMESREDGPSLSYQLSGTVSLASRDDQQMVRILNTSLASEFYHVASPVLVSYVYREATLKNDSDADLLAGPITVYLGDRFVGRGEVPTVARGQTFVVGFGADSQLRAKRELVTKEEDIRGGNRELTFAYRLLVENFKDAPVEVRLFDRLPYVDQTEQIRVTLGDVSDPLSDDKLYQRAERPKGILRWDIEVPANATGEDARLINYQYAVEFDRSFSLTVREGQEQQEEFEKLQRQRITR